MCIKVRQNYLCGHYREKPRPCARPGGCTKLSCYIHKDADRVNPAEDYSNPCSKDWKYKDLQAQTDAASAARNQGEKAAKQKGKDDAKAKKQKEKYDAKAKGKGKGMGAGKAKTAKNTAADSTKRGTKRPRDGDDQDGPAPKRMGGQVDGTIEPMRRGRPLGRMPVFSKIGLSPSATELSRVLPSIEQPDDALELGSTKSFISDSESENKSIQNYNETLSGRTGDSKMLGFGNSDNESQSAGEGSGEESGSDKSSSESPPYTTHDSSESESELESNSSPEPEQEPETDGGGSDIEGGSGTDDEPGTVDNGSENSYFEPSDEWPVPEASPSPCPSPSRAGGRFVGPMFPKAPKVKNSGPALVPENDDALPKRCQGTNETGNPCKRRGHFKNPPNCHDHED